MRFYSHSVTAIRRAGEIAQWLRALTAVSEVLSPIPSVHMVAHSHLQRDLMPSSGIKAYVQIEDSYT